MSEILHIHKPLMPELIRRIREKLIEIYTFGKDSKKTIDELSDRCDKLKNLLRDMRSYNRVMVLDYEDFLDELHRQAKTLVRSSCMIERTKYIEKTRERSLKFQKSVIPFVRDQGYQGRDSRTGLIRQQEGKTVAEYMMLIFNI
jgi:hypothetical protein